MAEVSHSLLVTNLNVHGLNSPIKRQRSTECIKKTLHNLMSIKRNLL